MPTPRESDAPITVGQAYDAMLRFLNIYWSETKSDDVGGLLGELQMAGDGLPMDGRNWNRWLKCAAEASHSDRGEAPADSHL